MIFLYSWRTLYYHVQKSYLPEGNTIVQSLEANKVGYLCWITSLMLHLIVSRKQGLRDRCMLAITLPGHINGHPLALCVNIFFMVRIFTDALTCWLHHCSVMEKNIKISLSVLMNNIGVMRYCLVSWLRKTHSGPVLQAFCQQKSYCLSEIK